MTPFLMSWEQFSRLNNSFIREISMELIEEAKRFEAAQKRLGKTLSSEQLEDFTVMLEVYAFSIELHARNAQLIASMYREIEALRDHSRLQ
ncbi:MAG: hypothetical protein F6J95_023790 [Leptolyngbya sp. SIO1E4]|nr:hypothetical protein [Leptolyngbya sp. SIO1E4]